MRVASACAMAPKALQNAMPSSPYRPNGTSPRVRAQMWPRRGAVASDLCRTAVQHGRDASDKCGREGGARDLPTTMDGGGALDALWTALSGGGGGAGAGAGAGAGGGKGGGKGGGGGRLSIAYRDVDAVPDAVAAKYAPVTTELDLSNNQFSVRASG